jgi:enamine deaminase RidA (YjgF/YER057c/UK114 family)
VSVGARLAALGLSLPPVPPPVAAYVPAVRSGDLIWTSGQLPLVGGVLEATGKVGPAAGDGVIGPELATELARTCALNALAAIAAQLGSLDRVRRIVKVVGYVASTPDFTGQSLVVNGASELLGALFGDRGAHARSAVGVAVLPLDAPVEIELVAQIV